MSDDQVGGSAPTAAPTTAAPTAAPTTAAPVDVCSLNVITSATFFCTQVSLAACESRAKLRSNGMMSA